MMTTEYVVYDNMLTLSLTVYLCSYLLDDVFMCFAWTLFPLCNSKSSSLFLFFLATLTWSGYSPGRKERVPTYGLSFEIIIFWALLKKNNKRYFDWISVKFFSKQWKSILSLQLITGKHFLLDLIRHNNVISL